MSEFSEFMNLWDIGDAVDPRKVKQIPVLPMDDPLSPWHKEKVKSAGANKVMEKAFHDDILGPTPPPEACFPTGHPAITELNKMLHPESDPFVQAQQAQLDAMKKGGRAGLWAYKQCEKAGSVPEGLREATALFEDKASPEQKRLLEKAIEALDIGAWFAIFTQIFAKAL